MGKHCWFADNIGFEVKLLRLEGRMDEAKELEQVMRRMKINKLKQKVNRVKEVGLLAGRKIMDGCVFTF